MSRHKWPNLWLWVGIGLEGILAVVGVVFGLGVMVASTVLWTGVLLSLIWRDNRRWAKRVKAEEKLRDADLRAQVDAQIAVMRAQQAASPTSFVSGRSVAQMSASTWQLSSGIDPTSTTLDIEKANTPVPTGNTWIGHNTEAEWSNIPLLGWRTWTLQQPLSRPLEELEAGILEGTPKVPIGRNHIPWPDTKMAAQCPMNHEALEDKPIPHANELCNRCGIYVGKEAEYPTSGVVGVVAMTGRILEGEKGYRAAAVEVLSAAIAYLGDWYWIDDWAKLVEPEKLAVKVPELRAEKGYFPMAYPMSEFDPTTKAHTLRMVLETRWDNGIGAVVDHEMGYDQMVMKAATVLRGRGFFEEAGEALEYAWGALNGVGEMPEHG